MACTCTSEGVSFLSLFPVVFVVNFNTILFQPECHALRIASCTKLLEDFLLSEVIEVNGCRMLYAFSSCVVTEIGLENNFSS